MRHRVAGYKLGRDTEHRKSLWRNLAMALFTHGQITTTIPKAKSVRPFIEKLITTARKNDLASRRRIIAQLRDHIMVKSDEDPDVVRSNKRANRRGGYVGKLLNGPRIVKKLFDEIAPQYVDRKGGYTRIIKLDRHRIGDGADLCVLQLVNDEDTGPQVAGKYSRRRIMANHRMEIAAKIRKSGKSESEASTVMAETEHERETEETQHEQMSGEEVESGDEDKAGRNAD